MIKKQLRQRERNAFAARDYKLTHGQVLDVRKRIERALKQITGVEPTKVRAWWREYARRHG
jgi:hypothetical protein